MVEDETSFSLTAEFFGVFLIMARHNSQIPVVESSNATPAVRMVLQGANANPDVLGMEELRGKSNYFIGNDPKRWRTNVPRGIRGARHKV